MPVTDVHAVVPVKDFGGAKQRLAGVLDQPARAALFRAMLEDVLEALHGVASLAGIVLVTRDPEAVALAGRYGAESLIEPGNRGHTAAVELAARALAGRGAGALLQIPGDVPRVTVAEIEAVIAAHGPAPSVTIAPSRDHLGSNAVLCSPPDVFPFRFGDDSFRPHLAAARAIGIEPAVVERPGLGLDVDTPDDLETFLASPSDTRAYRFLNGSCSLPDLASRATIISGSRESGRPRRIGRGGSPRAGTTQSRQPRENARSRGRSMG